LNEHFLQEKQTQRTDLSILAKKRFLPRMALSTGILRFGERKF